MTMTDEEEEHTLGDVAVHRVDDDGDFRTRHVVSSRLSSSCWLGLCGCGSYRGRSRLGVFSVSR